MTATAAKFAVISIAAYTRGQSEKMSDDGSSFGRQTIVIGTPKAAFILVSVTFCNFYKKIQKMSAFIRICDVYIFVSISITSIRHPFSFCQPPSSGSSRHPTFFPLIRFPIRQYLRVESQNFVRNRRRPSGLYFVKMSEHI